MVLTREYRADIAIIKVHGKLVGGLENTGKCHDCFGETLRSGCKHIIIDLGDAPWANSQGIGMLIGAYTTARNAGAELVLASVSRRIRDVLDVTRLTRIFGMFDTVDEAAKSFGPGPRRLAESAATPAVSA